MVPFLGHPYMRNSTVNEISMPTLLNLLAIFDTVDYPILMYFTDCEVH